VIYRREENRPARFGLVPAGKHGGAALKNNFIFLQSTLATYLRFA